MAYRCPKSIITVESSVFMEQFLYWKRCGGDLWSFDAKTADAMLLLEDESLKEKQNEQK